MPTLTRIGSTDWFVPSDEEIAWYAAYVDLFGQAPLTTSEVPAALRDRQSSGALSNRRAQMQEIGLNYDEWRRLTQIAEEKRQAESRVRKRVQAADETRREILDALSAEAFVSARFGVAEPHELNMDYIAWQIENHPQNRGLFKRRALRRQFAALQAAEEAYLAEHAEMAEYRSQARERERAAQLVWARVLKKHRAQAAARTGEVAREYTDLAQRWWELWLPDASDPTITPESIKSSIQDAVERSRSEPIFLNDQLWLFEGSVYEVQVERDSRSPEEIHVAILEAFGREKSRLERLRSRLSDPQTAQPPPRIPQEVRREVWARDGGMCANCGSRENLEFRHIVPVSQGGSNRARNIELLCTKCSESDATDLS